MKRLCSVLILVSFLLSGCYEGNTAPEDEVTKLNENNEFGVAFVLEENLNPITTQNNQNADFTGLVYEGLFEVDENFNAVKVLCESYTEEGNTYRIKLKSNVSFSDGTPLTANDVVYSLNLAKAPESYYASRLSNVSGISASGNEITISLYRANARLPQLLDIPIIKESSPAAIGTGPYKILVNGETNEYRLSKNSNWHRKEPLPFESIKMMQVSGIDELTWGFESRKIDLLNLDPTGVDPLQFRGEYNSKEIYTSSLVYLGFNFRNNAFQSAALRRAISCMIDRQGAVEQDFALMGTATVLPIHPKSHAYDNQIAETVSYSKEKAFEHFAEAGLLDSDKDGKIDTRRSYSLLVNSENKSRASLARRISEALTNIGITVNVREEKWQNYRAALLSGDFDLFLAEVDIRADFNVSSLIRSDGTLNYGQYYSETTDISLDKYVTSSLSQSNKNADFYSHFTTALPIVPILFKNHSVITHENFFENITPTAFNTYRNFYSWKVVDK